MAEEVTLQQAAQFIALRNVLQVNFEEVFEPENEDDDFPPLPVSGVLATKVASELTNMKSAG